MAEEETFLTIEEIAEKLRVSDRTVRRWIESGKLSAYKPGGEWRIRAGELDAFLETHSHPKAEAPQASGLLEALAESARVWGELVTHPDLTPEERLGVLAAARVVENITSIMLASSHLPHEELGELATVQNRVSRVEELHEIEELAARLSQIDTLVKDAVGQT